METNEKLSVQVKLKPHQRLSCTSCFLYFDDVLSASEHIINCKSMPTKKGKKFSHSKQGGSRSSQSCLKLKGHSSQASQWTRPAVALLLKSIRNWIQKLGDPQHDQLKIWQSISSEMMPKYPWAFQSVCQIKWRKISEDVQSFESDSMNQDSERPDFFYVVREIQRKMTTGSRLFSHITSLDLPSVKVEEDFSCEEDLADPDAIEEDPFSGVLDSGGKTVMREALLEIVQSIEENEHTSIRHLAEKHEVEEAIVEWVKSNFEAVIKGSLKCFICGCRILKRKDYTKHVLNCARTIKIASRRRPSAASKDSLWSTGAVAKLIGLISKVCQTYVSPQGTLRSGVWLEVYRSLRSDVKGLTPRVCCNKWTNLLLEARAHHFKVKECLEKRMKPPEATVPFYEAISQMVDLSRSKANEDLFITPCNAFLEGRTTLPMIDDLLIYESDDDDDPVRKVNFKRLDSFLLRNKGDFATTEIEADVSLATEEEDFDDDDDDDDLLEEEESEPGEYPIKFENSEDELENFKIEYPDPVEPSIQLLPQSKPLFHFEGTPKTENAMEGMKRKSNAMASRLSELEAENKALKSATGGKARSNLSHKEQLDEFMQIQTNKHLQTVNLLREMLSALRSNHKESMEAILNLTNALSGKLSDAT